MANMPANLRISAQFPFPAGVAGAAPVQITKANGVWTVALNIAALGAQVPPPVNYPTDYILVYDATAQTFFKMSLTSLIAATGGGGAAAARPQRFVNSTPIVVGATDQIITCGINVNATCALPASATRNGVPLTFKDLGFASLHPILFTPNGAETIDGAGSVTLNSNRQEFTFMPFNDGVNSGWFIS